MAPLGWYSAQPLHLAAGLPHFLFPEDTVKAATSNRITHGLPFAPLLTEHPLLLGILSRIHAFFSSTNAYQASGPVAQWPSGPVAELRSEGSLGPITEDLKLSSHFPRGDGIAPSPVTSPHLAHD